MFHVKHQIHYTKIDVAEVQQVQALVSNNKRLLEEYISKLLWWNKKINLVSRDVSRETLWRHVEHSLTLTSSSLFKRASNLVDSGTGGGLPGIPLAIAFPEKKVVLNDIVSKKITACKHMASVLKLKNIKGIAGSIKGQKPTEDALLVSKHAFKINDLFEMIEGQPWSGVLLLKGKEDVEKELEGLKVPLKIEVIDLYSGFKHPFYKGKALVEIQRKA